MLRPNTKLPTDETVKRDFEAGTVQPGPGMSPDKPPAEDERCPGATEEFRMLGTGQKKGGSDGRAHPGDSCGCG